MYQTIEDKIALLKKIQPKQHKLHTTKKNTTE